MAHGAVNDVPVQRVFRVNILFELGTSKCSTGFYLRDLGLNGQEPQDVVDAVQPIANVQFRALLLSGDKLTAVDAIRLDNKTGAQHAFSTTAGSVALSAENTMPSFNACTLALRGELRSKQGHGRMFLPARPDTFVSAETINAAGVTAINAFITAMNDEFLDGGVGQELRLCNYHKAKPAYTNSETGTTRPALPESYYDVVSMRLNTTVTPLGSRKVGRGS